MESISNLGSLRPRSCWLEIDLDALKNNFEVVKSKLSAETPILAVVKADAYGHGAEIVSKTLSENGVDFFGVATLEEALKLRQYGLQDRILIMGHTATFKVDEMINQNITPMIYSYRMMKALQKESQRQNSTTNIHLKIDTGMGRLGLLPNALPSYLDKLKDCPNLNLEGVATHFPAAGENPSYTLAQYEEFKELKKTVRSYGFNPRYWHSNNSAAIFSPFPPNESLVRPGLTLYGYSPLEELKIKELKPVMQVKSKLADFKCLPPGKGVSYGRTFIPKEPTWIGVIPLGYADGYPRDFSNRGYVLKSGKRHPVLGRVCMDMTVIKLFENDDPEATVTIMGEDGTEQLWADELARWHNTITYEILTRFSQRLPRIYIKNKKAVAIKTEQGITENL